MWALLPRRIQVLLIVAATLIVTAAMQALISKMSGADVGGLQLMGAVAFVVGTIMSLVLSFAWRPLWRFCPQLAHHAFPDLNGEWKGELVSTWIDPSTGKGIPPIPTSIHITQGLFSISVKLRTGESKSHSLRCYPEAFHDAGRFRIWYTYSNDPKAKVRYRSAPHNGLAWLELDIDSDPNALFGMYYTDRKSTGDITVTRTPAPSAA